MKIDELDYTLPPSSIATHPAEPRDHSRMLVYRRSLDVVEHRRFYELPGLLDPSDLLIVNDTKVLPAKLLLHKTTGASIPGLFVEELSLGRWRVMLRSRGKLDVGATLLADADPEFIFHIVDRGGEKGHWIMEVTPARPVVEILERVGHVPLPPYIERARAADARPAEEAADRTGYQTIYAQPDKAHSLAAPTAGLHFTPDLLEKLAAKGVRQEQVTLHVGLGTFLPVETDTLEAHKMHCETYAVPAQTVAALRRQRAVGGRIIVVGTTATRTLEAAAGEILDLSHPPADIQGITDLMISPGYRLALTDVLITNFHLPRSTLMALVSAMIGVEKLKALYRLAIEKGYRFYSYGDAMLILP